MKKRNRCATIETTNGCQIGQDVHTVQPFPSSRSLANNANLPLPILSAQLQAVGGAAYSYVVRTVKLKKESEPVCFEQTGSAPNFQGGVLTLCTCKHQMRSRLSVDDWEAQVWIAGFTSRTIHEGERWLFFLAKVKSAHDSHGDLWGSMDADTRKEKAAHVHLLGDMYEPIKPKLTGDARFSPRRYLMPPIHAHRQYPGDNGWKNDINYRHAAKTRQPPLLVADLRQTFLWNEPTIFLAHNHCRDYLKWSSLQELVSQLREAR
jgi:hypothetical protein